MGRSRAGGTLHLHHKTGKAAASTVLRSARKNWELWSMEADTPPSPALSGMGFAWVMQCLRVAAR
ncbi:MAG: hypothetical protein TE42_06905 [Candidatus Synechococcus spongiarum SP3]|uniref:Uncharacterized protein n=1 Tax=Candidatus Synechococcus spongiarum SP3 TaxID=1604020 RepID=A0A0G2HLG2_9SYNE|nr:MAG: hypothetical protein TE42_06905 [Candidatus Synechococcus spongiarum SP3]